MPLRKQDFKKINDYLWEIPVTYRHDMRVPVHVYADERLFLTAGQESKVVGKASSEEAKMTGMTPPALTLSGRWVD